MSYLGRLIPALVVLFFTAPLFAGTLYVPIVEPDDAPAGSYQTRIWLTNHASKAVSVTTVRMRGPVDGTARREAPVRHRVAAGATRVLTPTRAAGLLEIQAPASVAVKAEIRNLDLPARREVFETVPVIGSANAVPAGGTAVLQGLRRTRFGVRSQLGLVNLGHQPAECGVVLAGPSGVRLGAADGVRLPPLSHLPVSDVLELLDVQAVADANVRVSCSRPFYAYLAVTSEETGGTVFVEPSGTGASNLRPPAAGNGGGNGSSGKAHVFTRNGLVHSPSRKNPTWTHNFRVPARTDFSKVVLEMDVTPGAWYRPEPEKMHSLFWLHRGGCCWPKYNANILGYANAFGPGKGGDQVKVTHNLNRSRRPFPKLKQGFRLQRGTTYRLRYVYDGAGGRISLKVYSGGKLRFETTDKPTVKAIRSDDSGEFMVYLGHTPHPKGSGYGPERPTFGWKYSNLRLEFHSA